MVYQNTLYLPNINTYSSTYVYYFFLKMKMMFTLKTYSWRNHWDVKMMTSKFNSLRDGKIQRNTAINVKTLLIHQGKLRSIAMYLWLIDWIELKCAVSAIFQPCNGGQCLVCQRCRHWRNDTDKNDAYDL